jgi:hypothetical protein
MSKSIHKIFNIDCGNKQINIIKILISRKNLAFVKSMKADQLPPTIYIAIGYTY